MNRFCKYGLHQMGFALNSLVELVVCLEEHDLQKAGSC